MAQPVKLFYCYARANEDALQSLQKSLKPLERSNLIQPWHSHQIMPGATIAQEVETHLDQAQVVILLLSPDFLASDYCYGVEMARALQLHQEGKVHVVPVILHHCFWNLTHLEELQALPTNGRPISEWTNPGAAWHDVAKDILELVQHIQEQAGKETEPNRNETKSKRKPRESARTKRRPMSGATVKEKGTRMVQTTRVSELPKPELPKYEQAFAEEPQPTTPEAETATPEYDQQYGTLQDKINQISFKILVWEPSLPIEGIAVNERRNIYTCLRAEKHQCWLGKELKVPPGASLQDREVEQAFNSDLTVLLVEAPALGEMHEFCKHEDLLANTLIFYPEEMKSAPENWGLDKRLSTAYRHLEYYQEKDLIRCSVRTDVQSWVQARRGYRYSNSVQEKSGR